MTQPSHRITENGDKIVIHDLEVFAAYDPAIDGDHDEELKSFDNDRVQSIVQSTQRYMQKGSFPRLVVMHERDGNEPKASVGRFTKINYQERNGVGYIVGDCEVERSAFDRLLATNAFPRRSAEIWQDHNHLSEVALLGRETPRRPLPDTHFTRKGKRVTFSRPLRFDMGTVGGGISTFVPSTKGNNMDNDLREEMAMLRAAMEELRGEFKKRFAEDEDETIDMGAYERDAEAEVFGMSDRELYNNWLRAANEQAKRGDWSNLQDSLSTIGKRLQQFPDADVKSRYLQLVELLKQNRNMSRDDKEEMAADDMLQQQFAEEGKDIHIDIDSHQGAPDEIEIEEDEDEDVMFPASRRGHADVFAMRRENARMARELKELRDELKQEKFSRELDTMESEGYRIPAERRSALIGELIASRDPAQLIDTWRELFARDPMGVRIDMSRAQLPTSDIDHRDVSDLVREFAGKPEEFRKAVNSRMKKR